ncbi:MAG: hypothetical protein AVDCRST_MAG57-2750, partial [uncultured Blastococcus sp.]
WSVRSTSRRPCPAWTTRRARTTSSVTPGNGAGTTRSSRLSRTSRTGSTKGRAGSVQRSST